MILLSHSWPHIQRKLNLKKKNACTPIFTETQYTVAKKWKQPICPMTDEWIKKMWNNVHNGVLISLKKEWNNATCSNMDGPRDYYTKWNKSKKNIRWYHLKNRNWVTGIENKLMITKGEKERKINQGLGMNRYTLLHINR